MQYVICKFSLMNPHGNVYEYASRDSGAIREREGNPDLDFGVRGLYSLGQ